MLIFSSEISQYEKQFEENLGLQDLQTQNKMNDSKIELFCTEKRSPFDTSMEVVMSNLWRNKKLNFKIKK